MNTGTFFYGSQNKVGVIQFEVKLRRYRKKYGMESTY